MTSFSAAIELNGNLASGLVLLADHARNALPEEYGSLGLAKSSFERHIAYDIGIESLTRGLSDSLGAPAVMAGFSRLLIDPNRGDDDPTLIMKISDGAIIPANHPLAPQEMQSRVDRYYRPYHDGVAAMIERVRQASGIEPLVISLHSFTPFWKGIARRWHAGILWDNDDRAVRPLLAALEAPGDIQVGDNEPYDGALRGDTMYKHCMMAGLAHALIEVRQDLIDNADGVGAWVERLTPIIAALNKDPALHVAKVHPSRTGPYPKKPA